MSLEMLHAEAGVAFWSKEDTGMTVTLKPGTLRLVVCDDRIIRVQYAKEGPLRPLPDIVQNRKWTSVPFTVVEKQDRVMLKTKAVTASVGKADGVLSFADASGRPFLTEADPGSRIVRSTGEGTPPGRSSSPLRLPPTNSSTDGAVSGGGVELARDAPRTSPAEYPDRCPLPGFESRLRGALEQRLHGRSSTPVTRRSPCPASRVPPLPRDPRRRRIFRARSITAPSGDPRPRPPRRPRFPFPIIPAPTRRGNRGPMCFS